MKIDRETFDISSEEISLPEEEIEERLIEDGFFFPVNTDFIFPSELEDIHKSAKYQNSLSIEISTEKYNPGEYKEENTAEEVSKAELPISYDTTSIITSAISIAENVESRGRLFNVKKSNGDTYHTVEVLYAFISYKLDPEIQRKMPGIEIVFRPDDHNTSFDIHNPYRKKGLAAFDYSP